MQTDTPAQFDVWMNRWSDLIDFELVPVLTSAEATWTVLNGDPD
jgi:Protein of unknown function (DUF3303)